VFRVSRRHFRMKTSHVLKRVEIIDMPNFLSGRCNLLLDLACLEKKKNENGNLFYNALSVPSPLAGLQLMLGGLARAGIHADG
jgi:hypothetical protein